MDLYSTQDIQAITDKLDKIVDDAIEQRNIKIEPLLQEYLEVKTIIVDFIKSKKRVIYGGTAYNELIKMKNEKDKIYKDNERKDIEFYTPTPLEDLVEICDILHEKKFKYVQGRQAMHSETYTIFVNFEQFCDMSYMPSNIYFNMPTIKKDNVLYSHPLWILVDILRQYNDPILSYWRLKDKTFFRANILLKNYPLELEKSKKIKTKENKYGLELFNKIVDMKTLIFVGSIAEEYYKERSTKLNLSNLECISVNYIKDVKKINDIIKNILGDLYSDIVINNYRPFFQFWDDRVEFIINDITLISIFNHNNICIPYNLLYLENDNITKIQLGGHYKLMRESKTEDIIKIGTFILLFNHLLIKRHYNYINRSEKYKLIEGQMSDLLIARKDYLEKNALTVMDSSPYKEFIIRCSGETIDSFRKSRLDIIKKKQKGIGRLTFSYDPENPSKAPDYVFTNTSGNLNKNGNKKLFS